MTLVLSDLGSRGTDACWSPNEGSVSSLLGLGAAEELARASGRTGDEGGVERLAALEGCGAVSIMPCGNPGPGDRRNPTATDSAMAICNLKLIARKPTTSSRRAEFGTRRPGWPEASSLL